MHFHSSRSLPQAQHSLRTTLTVPSLRPGLRSHYVWIYAKVKLLTNNDTSKHTTSHTYNKLKNAKVVNCQILFSNEFNVALF